MERKTGIVAKDAWGLRRFSVPLLLTGQAGLTISRGAPTLHFYIASRTGPFGIVG